MALIASLVVGANGATALHGNSQGLSTPPDRTRFLALHRSAAAIITGKESATSEDYTLTTVPIYVLTRDPRPLTFSHPHMEQILINGDLAQIVREIEKRHDSVVVEAGPLLLQALVEVGVVDQLELSLSPIDGDKNFVDIERLLHNFIVESDELVDGTRLLQGRYRSNTTNS